MGIRILLADDHKMIRLGLISLLSHQSDIEIIGEAEDGRYAVELARELQPDIVITEVRMPRLNGIVAARQIIIQNPQVKIIALSGHPHEFFAISMFQAGASAYILTECLFDELFEAIRAVSQGRKYLSPKVASAVVTNYISLLSMSNKSALNTLSKREREAFQLIADGKSTQQIAAELQESIKSIEAYRHSIMEKLNAGSENGLLKFAIAGGTSAGI
ncbi:MAG: response regulator transcription factor [Sedimentisphaerales bacterium]|nr:response regulator transcription factor [Sedimentisphaerales bacterium]